MCLDNDLRIIYPRDWSMIEKLFGQRQMRALNLIDYDLAINNYEVRNIEQEMDVLKRFSLRQNCIDDKG